MILGHLVLSTVADNLKIGYDTLSLNCERSEHRIGLGFLLCFDG
jgi:hypothetical protein